VQTIQKVDVPSAFSRRKSWYIYNTLTSFYIVRVNLQLTNTMNRIAIIPGAGKALEIVSAEVHHPGPGEILVKNEAIAIQPLDAKMLLGGYSGAGSLGNYPAVLGTSGAGTVAVVGEGVSEFTVGDRVVFDTRALVKPETNDREGTWQRFVVVSSKTAAKVRTITLTT
jgi:NADPH:quinone reductase-like Zn-dependent oxidoreductase